MKKIIFFIVILSFAVFGLNVFAENAKDKPMKNKDFRPILVSTTTTTPPIHNTSTKPIYFDSVCMTSVITTRENSVITAYDQKVNTMKTALETRKNAMILAAGSSTLKEAKKAIKKANDDFAKAKWQANKDYNASIKSAQTKFKTDKKKCTNGAGFLDNNDLNL